MDRTPTPPPDDLADTAADREMSRPSDPRILTGHRYRQTGEIGHGGMGEVVAAQDVQIGREVAIKRMRVQDPSDRAIGRFMREARIQGRLEHPAIPPVHELGRDVDGRPYFVMKKLAGTTLAAILDGEPSAVSRTRLLRAFAEVCLAVEFAHTRGVLHRDLKPENIMLGEFGEVYVLDWGVAKLLGDALDRDDGFEGSDSARDATATGAAIGTPGYMAPEQVTGDPGIDARADVYALGCVLFEILAGAPLHPRGAAGMMSAVEGRDGSPGRRAPDREIPPELDALCVAATATSRDDRLATARALGDGVQRFLDGDRDVAMRVALARRHHDDAIAAADRGDRGIGMREAARAIALDPTQTAAADLIARLVLDPPRETPPEVVAALERDGEQMFRDHTRLAVYASLALLLFAPLVFAVAPLADAVAFAASVGVTMFVLWLGGRGHRPPIYLYVVTAALVIAAVSQVFSPIAFPQALACMGAFLLTLNPQFKWRPRTTAVVMMLLPIGLVVAAETAGIVSPTFTFDDGGIHLFAPGLRGGPVVTAIAVTVSCFVSVLSSVYLAYGIRATDADTRRRLHVQAWQLRHLVPETAAPAS